MATNNENKVIGYLLNQDQRTLTSLLQQLSGVTWSKNNQPIIDLCKSYTRIHNPDFFLFDFVANEVEEVAYVSRLFVEGTAVPDSLMQQTIEKLIQTQEEALLKNTLVKLKDKPINQVLSEIKQLRGIAPVKPLNLTAIKEKRMRDRDLEKEAPSTGYASLDAYVKGFVPGRTYVMTGATNVGKSTMACNFAYRVAKQGKKVLYFSLEPDTTIIEYLASIWARKRFSDISEGDLTPPVEIDVYTKEHVNVLEDMIAIVENSDRYDLIIVDHFGYFISDGKNPNQTEKNAMKMMASFARRNKTALLLIVHPRKPMGSTRKQRDLTIHDISGSAAFSQDATDVLVIARSRDPEDPLGITYLNEGYVAVHKTKSGNNGAMKIHFIEGAALILDHDEWATNQAQLF